MAKRGYNPLLVRAVVAGRSVRNPADVEDAFTASYENDLVQAQVGLYGDGRNEFMIARNGDMSITVKGGSSDCTAFQILADTHAEFDIQFVDKNSNTAQVRSRSATAAVRVVPDWTRGTRDADQTWVFSVPEMAIMHGEAKDV